jgi:hypothetical protein
MIRALGGWDRSRAKMLEKAALFAIMCPARRIRTVMQSVFATPA